MKPLLQQFCPAWTAASVSEITPEWLREREIRALILDLDNTLVPWHGQEVAPFVREWVASMTGAGVRLCIVSNTNRPQRLEHLAALLGVLSVPSGRKPRRRGFLRAIQAMESLPEQTAVVGDQLLTDIWGGNRCGLLTILVEPLAGAEFWGTRVISRNLERLIWRGLAGSGVRAERLQPVETRPAKPVEQP